MATQVRDDTDTQHGIPRLIIGHHERVVGDSRQSVQHDAEHGLPPRHERQECFVSPHAPALTPGERGCSKWGAVWVRGMQLTLGVRRFGTSDSHSAPL
jgi:hypothetical protein